MVPPRIYCHACNGVGFGIYRGWEKIKVFPLHRYGMPCSFRERLINRDKAHVNQGWACQIRGKPGDGSGKNPCQFVCCGGMLVYKDKLHILTICLFAPYIDVFDSLFLNTQGLEEQIHQLGRCPHSCYWSHTPVVLLPSRLALRFIPMYYTVIGLMYMPLLSKCLKCTK